MPNAFTMHLECDMIFNEKRISSLPLTWQVKEL